MHVLDPFAEKLMAKFGCVLEAHKPHAGMSLLDCVYCCDLVRSDPRVDQADIKKWHAEGWELSDFIFDFDPCQLGFFFHRGKEILIIAASESILETDQPKAIGISRFLCIMHQKRVILVLRRETREILFD